MTEHAPGGRPGASVSGLNKSANPVVDLLNSPLAVLRVTTLTSLSCPGKVSVTLPRGQ